MAQILQRSLQLSTKLKNYSNLPCLIRTITTSKSFASNYEGDGKTTVTILNREHKQLIMINSYSNLGFRLNNGLFAMGPVAVFPRTVLQWNVNSIAELTPESLSLFCLLEPKLDILIIGTGMTRLDPSKDVMHYLKANRIHAEILRSDQACTTFNFLNTEGRCVAGALIPPEEIVIFDDETRLLDSVEAIDDYHTIKETKIQQ